MHLSKIAFKLYAFVYNYSSVKPQEGGLIVALLRILMTHAPKCPGTWYINVVIGYDMSVKLARKPLKRSKSPTPQFIKFDILATLFGL